MRTVVIGGGAAGIAAAHALHGAGREVLLLEASDRLGGRARSVRLPGSGATVDLGCGWLHSAARNPWTALAERAGFTVDRSPANWDQQWCNLGFSPEERRAFDEAWARWEAAALGALDGPDRPLSDFVAADDSWRPLIDAISGYVNGAPLARVSLYDWARYEAAATGDNWSVRGGFGTLVESHIGTVPVRLNTSVSRVDRRGRLLRLQTAAGTIEAAHAIVAVPTPVLASGTLSFDPPLPGKRDAAADLPLGLADKIFLGVDHPEWPADQHLIGSPRSACTASHRLSPHGWPVIESFFGGDCAEALESGDAAGFAIDELVSLLGSSWRKRLHPLAVTRWRHEQHIAGSYSHARVGCSGQRALLAEPVEDRVFFAGEACSLQDFSTAHGAYQTGIDAAAAILAQR